MFSVLWFTFAYLPIAHMVWATGGYRFEAGDLGFAGGTVVHINSGVAALDGVGVDDYSMAGRVFIQAKGVLITVLWSGIVSLVAFKLIDMTMGLRVSEEQKREGPDTASHGERAYNA